MVDSLYGALGKMIGVEEISAVQWKLGNALPPTFLGFALVGAFVFVGWSCYRESFPSKKGLLVLLRFSGLALLVLALLQPQVHFKFEKKGESRVFALLDRSESMSISDDGDESRWGKAIQAFSGSSESVLAQLGDDHEIEVLTVGNELKSASVEGLRDEVPQAGGSAIGSAMDELKEKDLSAVLLFSDMAWNEGIDPVGVAGKLGRRGVAVFPVPIGKSNSPDAAILSVHFRDRVFPGEEIPLKVQLSSTPELDGMSTDLVISLGDEEVSRQLITYVGGQQIVEIPLKGQTRKGRVRLQLELEGVENEISLTNNKEERFLTFLDDKVKVLYVEGAPRWEYRYLRTVLMRDSRLEVKFLMTKGDPDLAKYSPEYISEFPAVGESTLDFDLVILGDVDSRYFERKQMEWMVKQVNRLGGAMLMLGGAAHTPQSYRGSPIEDLLPVKLRGDQWVPVPNELVASPTDEGLLGRIATLGVEESMARKLWSQISPLYQAPSVTAKPGANVLVTLGRKRVDGLPYPLVAWQRFGAGKSMFVGTELLWRLRKTVGRQYHESFWSTTIQFMTLSRLLGGNERITLEVDRNRYSAGESVRLHADVLDDYLEPVEDEKFTVTVAKVDDSSFEDRELDLRPVPGAKGFFQAYYLPPDPGDYEIVATGLDKDKANVIRFSVFEESLEMRRPGMRLDVAEQIAKKSSGEVIRLDDLGTISTKIEERRPRSVREITLRLWDHPLLYLLLLLVAGSEWWLRRRLRLV